MYIDNFDLNFTAYVYSCVDTSNGTGGNTRVKTLRKTVKCAFWQNGASESIVSGRYQSSGSHTMACSVQNTFRNTDEIVIDGKTYRITKPDDIMGYGDIMVIGLNIQE